MVWCSFRALCSSPIVLGSIAVAAYGQSPPGASSPPTGVPVKVAKTVRSGFTTLVRDEALLWSSPLRFRRDDLDTIVPLMVVTGAALRVDRGFAAGLPNSNDQIRYSKGVSVAGTYYSLGAAAGAFVGLGALAGNRRAVETGLIAAQAIAHTESIAQMLKYAAGRERPDFGDAGSGRFWRRQQSFPSGHAMATWAVAAVISREYCDNRFIRYGIYALPVLVSASRIGAQRHFLADVVAGGSIGYLMGAWLYDRHHNPDLGGGSIAIGRISLKPDVRYDRRWGGFGFGLSVSR